MVKKLVAFDEYPWQFDKDFLVSRTQTLISNSDG